MTRKEMYETRLTIVHQMHKYIMNIGDEEITELWWRDCIPDNPCEEDFEYWANDIDEFKILCNFFGQLVCYGEEEDY